MADFCKQCSEHYFDQDFGELAGLTNEQEEKDGLFACVLCEGCGESILVNRSGKRMDKDWQKPEE